MQDCVAQPQVVAPLDSNTRGKQLGIPVLGVAPHPARPWGAGFAFGDCGAKLREGNDGGLDR